MKGHLLRVVAPSLWSMSSSAASPTAVTAMIATSTASVKALPRRRALCVSLRLFIICGIARFMGSYM